MIAKLFLTKPKNKSKSYNINAIPQLQQRMNAYLSFKHLDLMMEFKKDQKDN
jgi:hypothetical protein